MERLRVRGAERRESGDEHGVLEAVVSASGLGLAANRFAGLSGDGGEAGVGGEFVAGDEAIGMTNLGEDACSCAGSNAGHGQEHVTETVRAEDVVDLDGEAFASLVEAFELAGDLDDDLAEHALGGQGKGLGVECSEYSSGDASPTLGNRCGQQFRDLGRSSSVTCGGSSVVAGDRPGERLQLGRAVGEAAVRRALRSMRRCV